VRSFRLALAVAVTAALATLVAVGPPVTAASPSPGSHFGEVTRDYIVPTPLGELFLEVVHPTLKGHVVDAPVILTYTPYAVLGRNGDANHWVDDKGYTRATADVIGTGNSGGCYDYGGNREKRTGHDLIGWIARQGWSDGKVAMLGGSYDGTTQYATAVTRPKGLVTIVPEAAIDRWYDYAYSGGIRYTDTNEDLGHEGPATAGDEGVDTPLGFDYGFAIPPPIDNNDPDWGQRVASTIQPCDELKHTTEAYSDNPNYGGFWKERDYLRDMPRVHIPVLVASNWGDWNVKQVDGWQIIHALANSPDSRAIFGGRWHGHGVPQNTKDFSYDAPGGAVDQWMDHWLRGAHNGVPASLPRITTRSANDNTELGYTAAPWTQGLRLTLSHGAAGFALTPNGGTSPAGSPAASYAWTETNTESAMAIHPFAPGPGYIGFVSPVIPKGQSLRIYGEPVLHFRSTISGQWVTTAASLVDLDPATFTGSGPATTATSPDAVVALTRGWLDSRYRHGLGDDETVTPGKPFTQNLALKPTDYTLAAGHRLVLLMSTETLEWAKSKLPDSPANNTVTIDYGQGQSYLTLPSVWERS
jgi:predicted acyl esterase